MEDNVEELRQAAAQFGISLTAQQGEQFETYLALLQTWNERINLTAIREREEIIIRHFLDSLTCTLAMGDLNGRSLIDVGSGAGFPGLPLKILYPDLRLTLVESVQKKAGFLEAIVEALQLTQTTILPQRAETIGQDPAHRAGYDWAAARAVAELRTLLEYLLPLCRVGGHALAQKGENAASEAAAAATALETLGGGEVALHEVQLPGREQLHYLVTVTKTAVTPERYPRRPGRPGKRPL